MYFGGGSPSIDVQPEFPLSVSGPNATIHLTAAQRNWKSDLHFRVLPRLTRFCFLHIGLLLPYHFSVNGETKRVTFFMGAAFFKK